MNPAKVNKYGFYTENEEVPSDTMKLNARIEKWSKMLENWESFSLSNSKLLKSRIRKGIPASLRGEVWQLLAKTSSLKKSYLRHHFFRLTNSIEDPDCMFTIEKDLNRTYPTHELFKSTQGQDSLRAILRAYAHFDEEIGYCQGMAYLVGVPRMFMDEENSFWMLVAILRNYDMRGMFKEGMEKVYQSYYKANAVLKQFENKIWKKMVGIGFFTQIYATNWFMTVFSSFPVETKMRIWDCFLLEGPKILFRVFVAVFRAHRKLFKNVAFDTCLQVIRGIEKTCDADSLIKAAFSFSLSRKRLKEIEREYFYEPKQDLVTWQ